LSFDVDFTLQEQYTWQAGTVQLCDKRQTKFTLSHD